MRSIFSASFGREGYDSRRSVQDDLAEYACVTDSNPRAQEQLHRSVQAETVYEYCKSYARYLREILVFITFMAYAR